MTEKNDPITPAQEETPWIERPETLKKLKIFSGVFLVLLLLMDIPVHHHQHFKIAGIAVDGSFGFYSWFGFVSCVAMVWFSKKFLGKFLTRKDDYYERDI